jgi:nicotinamidase-related amidase
MGNGLREVPLTENAVHLCIDMQRLFSDEGPWPTPWMKRVLPVIEELSGRFPARTIFTRFVTPVRPEDMPGTWRRFYMRWPQATRAVLPVDLLDLVPQLARFAPPAIVIDKARYSAFSQSALLQHLRHRRADTLVVTGSETDVCILASVLDAVDHGYRVIVVRDAVCSSSDEGHEALLQLYHRRYSEQVETADMQEILSCWS